jgi:hypothetical protein
MGGNGSPGRRLRSDARRSPYDGPQFQGLLARARRVKSGTYDGPKGEQTFREHLKRTNEAGGDLVGDGAHSETVGDCRNHPGRRPSLMDSGADLQQVRAIEGLPRQENRPAQSIWNNRAWELEHLLGFEVPALSTIDHAEQAKE